MLIFAVCLLTYGPSARADRLPTPVEPPETFVSGYNWAERLEHTHLVVDGFMLYSIVNATSVTTPYIDLEMTGLMPWRPYELAVGVLHRAVHTDGRGRGVAWSVPTLSAQWVLTDRLSGEPVTMITVVAPAPDVSAPESGGIICYRCPSTTYSPPQPVYSDPLEQGMSIEQGAYSFDPTILIRIEGCWNHGMSIDAKASGGIAARGGAGAQYNYQTSECITFASQGQPRELRRATQFKRDYYEDGSWKVYSVGHTMVFSITDANVNWQPPSNYGYTIEVTPGPEPVVFQRREVKDLAIWMSAGVKTFGTDLGVRISSLAGSEARIQVEFMPTEPSIYQLVFVDERKGPDSALIAAAWRIA